MTLFLHSIINIYIIHVIKKYFETFIYLFLLKKKTIVYKVLGRTVMDFSITLKKISQKENESNCQEKVVLVDLSISRLIKS